MADIGRAVVFLLVVLLTFAAGLSASEAAGAAAVSLKPATVAAFDQYVKLTDARNNEELRRGTNLLWIDGLPESERAPAYEELKRGEVKMQRMERRENGGNIRGPGGVMHNWV